MSEEKSLYRSSSITSLAIFFVICIGMLATSIYLTHHFYEVKYPSDILGGSLCNINSFFNCDAATNSPLSNIAGIPISLFGAIIAVFFLFGFVFNNSEVERTNRFLSIINFVGCLVLLVYSLIALGSLCPFCSLYYILSGIACYFFLKRSNLKGISIKIFTAYAVVSLIVSAIAWNYVREKENNVDALAKDLLSQYNNLPNLGSPSFESPYYMAKSSLGNETPINIIKFSDFQCPACKALSQILHQAKNRYGNKINIQYYFYPLDHNCNPEIKRPLHTLACLATYITLCSPPEKFPKLEEKIFNAQGSFDRKWLEALAKEQGVSECISAPETKEKVQQYISEAKKFNVESTPTFLVNGVKIEGVLPPLQLFIILDSLIKKK